ncbi:MAG TPA: DUF1553 domain-containing protein [Planctomycetaceae bacterium]|nr:DUF1553 domain-containing protein [Planctomycetaceae bacterium]
MIRLSCLISLTLLGTSPLLAQNDSDPPVDQTASNSYRESIEASKPAAYWSFESDSQSSDTKPAWVHDAELRGKVQFRMDGPNSAQSPLFRSENRALRLDSKSYLVVKDPGEKSPFDFGAGETLTIEAWVNPEKIGGGQHLYIIGKGRTQNQEVARDNQNWALRLTGQGSSARIGLLFRDERNRAGNSEDWHRWTSNVGFAPNSGWHHVAVTYTFGKPDSVAGWVDGYPTAGTWDMGKQTTLAPVVDDDEIWIGSSMGGSTGSSFAGGLDEIALYRRPLTADEIRVRCPPQPEATPIADEDLPAGQVLVEVHEGIPDVKNWEFRIPEASESFLTNWLTFPEIPRKYSSRGIQIDRSNPVLIRAHCMLRLPAGEHRVLLRSLNGARVFAGGKELVRTPFHTISGTAHGHIRRVSKVHSDYLRMLQTGENEELATLVSDGSPIRITMEVFAGGGSKRPEFGEVSLCVESEPGRFDVLSPDPEQSISLTDRGWFEFLKTHRRFMTELNATRRIMAGLAEREYWDDRHERSRAWLKEQLPQDYVAGDPAVIDRLIDRRLESEGVSPEPLIDDWSFLRRATLDIVGTVPDPEQIREFFADDQPGRRGRYIERLLASPEYAEHWVGYWQDVLAENPNIINPTLNNTGPFRWWIHESFYDNKPIDRFVTELIRMEGSSHYGGPAGFEMATQNDVPMAAKAHIVGTAFLGVQMKCARCHDAPFHDIAQRDLFAMAAMLGREEQGIPKTSTINLSEEALSSLIVVVSIKPGDKIGPAWTFESLSDPEQVRQLLSETDDTREKLTRLITAPSNERFRNVIVNRLWKRYLGRGLVEPVDDWEFASPSHPEVLEYLSRELVLSGYDLKHLIRLILNTNVYQRAAVEKPPLNDSDKFHFAGPVRRRLSAEQLVDSIFAACGKDFHAGPMNIDVDGSRDYKSSLNLGRPYRAWMFTSTSNERDRPSLSLPLAQDYLSLMETVGWRSSRQDPATVREDSPTVLQAGILANGVVGRRFTRLSEDSVFTELALQNQPLEDLIEQVFVRALTRPPRADEIELFSELLRDQYEDRIVEVPLDEIKYYYPQTSLVSWSNHLDPETSEVMIAQEAEVRRGDPPTVRLKTEWRERMEDMLWVILNTPEFIVVP